MITKGYFVRYETFTNSDEVWDFLNKGIIYSKVDNYSTEIEKLVTYKKEHSYAYKSKNGKRKYENIYAYYLEVLIPKFIKKNEIDNFINKYVVCLDKRFKNLLYVYKKASKGDGDYALIMLFPRYVYKKKIYKTEKYNSDYYWNPTTKRKCKSSDPEAVLLHKKGEKKLDDEGKPIRKLQTCKVKAERVFIYTSFNAFMLKLKEKLCKTAGEFDDTIKVYKRVSKITVDKNDSNLIKRLKIKRNVFIDSVNNYLKDYQDSASLMQADDWLSEELEKLYKRVNEMIHVEKIDGSMVISYLKEWWIKNVTQEIIGEH